MPHPRLTVFIFTLMVIAPGVGAVDLPTEPDGPLTFQQAMALALAHNPDLAVFAWERRAAEARVLQAGLWPNPELAFSVEDIRLTSGPSTVSDTGSLSSTLGTETVTTAGGTDVPRLVATPEAGFEREREQGARSGFAESEFTVEVTQPIMLGRKIRKRMAVAEAEKAMVDWDYEIERQEVLGDVSEAFIMVLHAQERAALNEEGLQLAKHVRDTVQARVDAGRVSEIDLRNAEIAVSEAEGQVERAAYVLREMRIALASLWAADTPRFTHAVGDCGQLAAVPERSWLRGKLTENPEVKRWLAELDRRKAVVTLERANAWPDVEVTLGIRFVGLPDHDVDTYGLSGGLSYDVSKTRVRYDRDVDTTLVMGFSVPLPVFDRNQGNIAEAAALAEMAEVERRGTETSVRAGLDIAYERLLAAQLEATRIRDDILPKAQDVFDRIEEGYQRGKFDYLEVLEAQRTLFDLRYGLLDATEAYHLATVAMERLTGQPLVSVSAAGPEE